MFQQPKYPLLQFKQEPTEFTLASYLSYRLLQVGIKEAFIVPGDFNLHLIDEMFPIHGDLRAVTCPNELIAGYAADGYSRANGISSLVTLFNVGTLAASSAIAGARASRLPMIVIAGTMNSKDICTDGSIHHSIGKFSCDTSLDAMYDLTVYCCRIENIQHAHSQIDEAIFNAIKKRGPVYIEVCCDLVNQKVPFPKNLGLEVPESCESSLDMATNEIMKYWTARNKPMILLGANISHVEKCMAVLKKLIEITGVPLAYEPNARYHSVEFPTEVGLYWGPLSTPAYLPDLLQESDLIIGIGLTSTDYMLKHLEQGVKEKTIAIGVDASDILSNKVCFPEGSVFHHCSTLDVLHLLLQKLAHSQAVVYQKPALLLRFQSFLRAHTNYFGISSFRQPSWTAHKFESLIRWPQSHLAELHHVGGLDGYSAWLSRGAATDRRLESLMIAAHIQALISPTDSLILECGTAWFLSRYIMTPQGCDIQMQMQYGSIGWATGALLGYCTAVKGKKRVIAVIGDGALQMTVQALATIFKEKLNPIVLVLNNANYAIEDSIHQGNYNKLERWDFCQLASAFRIHTRFGWCVTVKTEKELSEAFLKALDNPNEAAFIDLMMEQESTDESMKAFGTMVSRYNMR